MARSRPLSVHVLDVGHGDSIVVEFPAPNSYAIVDCNRNSTTNRKATGRMRQTESKTLTFFRQLVEHHHRPVVEFVCLTHPHLDHCRGFADLLQGLEDLEIPVLQFWDFGIPGKVAEMLGHYATTKEERELRSELAKFIRKRQEYLERGGEWNLLYGPHDLIWSGHGVEVDVVAPSPAYWSDYCHYWQIADPSVRTAFAHVKPHVKNDNTVSSALLLRYGRFRILLAGDVTNETWEAVHGTATGPNLSCVAIKVSHHGSVEGSFLKSRPLCQVLSPVRGLPKALISGGYRDSLPHPATLQAFRRKGCRVYCTGTPLSPTAAYVPYAPPDVPEDLADLVREYMEHDERPHLNASGDIVIRGHKSGRNWVNTEF